VTDGEGPRASHPRATANGLVCGAVEMMPILDHMLPFAIMTESMVCTIETVDGTGKPRGGVVIGLAHHTATIGTACVSSIDEAKAMMALIEIAIADAERIERGEKPLAPEGLPRRDH
jgi:hypothetical protein